ncbi:hypothetical protein BN2475_550037 [Paraburkholderia ribeironis]|uniref:Uncharacterized protein n=1 Tax=Paraburkholderia ribeironis TaxID=1247936 RepID=A0A1N7SDG4_9BURK|nr:hypothetical protein BN2475_550037 [Paraburkholderia ribeironis]
MRQVTESRQTYSKVPVRLLFWTVFVVPKPCRCE